MAHCHMRRSAISTGRPEITWIVGNLEVICRHAFIVVWCNLWEVGAVKIAICDDREDDRGALKALLEATGRSLKQWNTAPEKACAGIRKP